jgi:hypothetical protein
MDVLTVLDVLIEPNAAEIADGNSLVGALENIDLVPSEFFISRYYETLKHQLSTIYRQFMLVYEDCCHEESTPQVKAVERAFKRSSEGRHLNNLIREKNVDGYLPRSVGEYMNAAEDLAAEAHSEKHAGTPTRPVVNRRHPGLPRGRDIKPPLIGRSVPVAAVSIMSTQIVVIGPIFTSIRTLRLSMRNLPLGFDTTVRSGDGISKSVTWIQLCRGMTAEQACNESGPGRTNRLDCRADLWAASGRYPAAEIPSFTVAAILRSARTLPCISRHINEIVGSVSQIWTLPVKSFTSSFGRQ